MQNSYKSMNLPSAEYVRLQQLMLTMIGSRTVLASILRRKLGAAAPVSSPVGSDVALSGRQVDFKIDGRQSQTGVLTWRPPKRGDATGLSLLSPRGLALLGLVPGETIAYSTESGRTELLEVAEVLAAAPVRKASPEGAHHRSAAPALLEPPHLLPKSMEGPMPDGRKSHGRVNGVRAPLLKRLGLYATRSLRRWQIGRTTDALQSLSDDMLHDIGIARADIPAIALA